MRAFESFMEYKTRVPVRGAIMLNEAMDSILLVKGWKKNANWSFPRGKINKDEHDLTCAVREVYEETGYDLKEAGFIPAESTPVPYIEKSIREQHMRLYIFRGIPMDTVFEPRTRKEISKIQWYRLSDLPTFAKKRQGETQGVDDQAAAANKFYMVAPFLGQLRKWIAEQKRRDKEEAMNNKHLVAQPIDDVITEEEPIMERRNPETAPQPQMNAVSSTPAIDTMEGATAALHQLLKIQPPTQGLQPSSGASSQPDRNTSGAALLALLHSGPGSNGTQTEHPGPDFGRLHSTRDSAHIVEHHRVPPVYPSASGVPQAFNIPPSLQTIIAPRQPGQYSSSSTHEDHVGHNFSTVPPHPIVHPQTHVHPQPPYQPQRILHPQPLPPQVQRTLFSGDQIHSPMVQSSSGPHQRTQPVEPPQDFAQPQFSNLHGPAIPTPLKSNPAQLTSHSLALLNAFRGPQPQLAAETMPAELAATSPIVLSIGSQQPASTHRSNHSVEHKQNLLSLLKQTSAAARAPAAEQSLVADRASMPFVPLPDTLNRSRVNSAVSAGADSWPEPASRRGSHTPISAADKGFLFGFLESSGKGKGRDTKG
jgi:mRNA-decapping enzyme subunit 2